MLMAVTTRDDHDITPQPGTVVREADGQPGNLLAVFDYPVRAVCITCGQQVRIERKFLSEWEHVTPERIAPV
jgi:ABC-type Fe2+-enterobactin transport system substrate-binding protein